jgi:hydroxymethylpyrimidine/phosphomethylpyrimidine kinase
VAGIHECPPEIVRAQVDAVLDDIGADAVKTGMLFSRATIETVADALVHRGLPLVVDPVMVSSTGARLLRDDAVGALVGRLFPLAAVVTPNHHEAEALAGLPGASKRELAEALHARGAAAVLVTGGHGEPVDHLFDGDEHVELPVPRYERASTHGAGCTHSASLAALLAQGETLGEAARRAGEVAAEAVRHGLAGLGDGDGPVDVLHLTTAQEARR